MKIGYGALRVGLTQCEPVLGSDPTGPVDGPAPRQIRVQNSSDMLM